MRQLIITLTLAGLGAIAFFSASTWAGVLGGLVLAYGAAPFYANVFLQMADLQPIPIMAMVWVISDEENKDLLAAVGQSIAESQEPAPLLVRTMSVTDKGLQDLRELVEEDD